MVRVLWIFALCVVFAGVAIWLADQPGDLVIHWRGYEIRTSFVVGLGVTALISFLVLFVYRLIATFMKGPAGFARFRADRRQKKGYLALSKGMVAVAAGDAKEARWQAAQAYKILDEPALTLLLSAQAAQLEGDNQGADQYFKAMLVRPETELLGLRGLFVQARREGQKTEALAHAKQAFALKSDTPWAAHAVFELQVADNDFDAATVSLDRMLKAKLVSRDEARRRRAVLLTARAQQLVAGEVDDATAREAADCAMEAVGLQPGFAPAAVLAAEQLCAQHKEKRALKILEAAWLAGPHAEIGHALLTVLHDESAYDRLARIQHLLNVGSNGLALQNEEERVLLATAAIAAREFDVARDVLAPSLQELPTRRVFELMADIEEGEFGHLGKAREWLSRALHAPRDAGWMAEGRFYSVWVAVVPDTHAFDVLRWESPDAPRLSVDAPTDPLGHADDEEQAGRGEPEVAAIVSVAESAEEDVSDAAASIAPASEIDKADDRSDSPQSGEPEIKAPIFVEPLVAPDDPGPLDDEDEKRGGTW
ncbi:MAG: hypothetical protein KUG61_04395 [Parvibaculaceae bacterium]|nr:hypothetical protein [Parvibaculaceae bacterium]